MADLYRINPPTTTYSFLCLAHLNLRLYYVSWMKYYHFVIPIKWMLWLLLKHGWLTLLLVWTYGLVIIIYLLSDEIRITEVVALPFFFPSKFLFVFIRNCQNVTSRAHNIRRGRVSNAQYMHSV